MRNILFVLTVAITAIASPAVYNKDVWQARSKGAKFEVSFRIVDDEGSPVVGARCGGWKYMEREKERGCGYAEYTDTNGCVHIAGKCSEWFSVIVRKEGHYMTTFDVKYPMEGATPPIIDGKWQPYGETRTVVLKKIKNPWAVKVFSGDTCHHMIPVFGEWLPFDMEKSDWLPPHGKGLCNDVILRFSKCFTDKWYDFSFTMEACFTNNPYAGVYIKPLDEFSDLKSSYSAETNANYCGHYIFRLESVSKKQAGLEKNQYLVFRTRTRVDENGNLVGAHYGKYCRSWRSDAKEMHFGAGCFNPVENDLNIEGDQPLLYKIKNNKK